MSGAARRALGAAAILVYLPAYVILATAIGASLTGAPWYAQFAFYAVAGVVWVLPLRPLFSWMGGRKML